MSQGKGRGRARGRGILGLVAMRDRPGSLQSHHYQSDEGDEQWEDGIETNYSVKSVTYSTDSKATFVTPEEPPVSHPGVTQTSAISGMKFSKEEIKSERSYFHGRPPLDDDDSDDDFGGWTFGSEQESTDCTPSNLKVPEEKAESDFERLRRNHPSVSSTWLASLQKKEKEKNEVDNRVKAASKEHIWKDVQLFNAESMNEAKLWHQRLEHLWHGVGCKMAQDVSLECKRCFDSVCNPYTVALYVIESASDYSSVKASTLSHCVAKEFERWTRGRNNKENILTELGVPLKLYAFYVGTRFHVTSFDLIVKAFKLTHPGNDYFITYLRPMIEQKKMKDAIHCIAKLGLQDHFDTEELLLPLILQDKINLVESYVYQRKKQQLELLKLLDGLCDRETDLNKLAEESGVGGIRYDKLQHKIIGKLAVRLLKLYQIDQEICPNIDNRRKKSAMRYLIYKFYIEETLSRENWRELLDSTVGGNRWLQEELVDELVTSSDIQEAVRWAKKFSLPNDSLPVQVVEAMEYDEVANISGAGADSEDWDEELLSQPNLYYYSMNLPENDIYFIDLREDFLNSIHYIIENADILGLDSEWRPSFGQEAVSRVALLQVATLNRVYLYDVPRLNCTLSDDDWIMFGQRILMNEKILKLGYGFESDLQMIVKTIPVLKDAFKLSKRMVEMSKLQHIIRANPSAFRCVDIVETCPTFKVMKSDEKGLSDLVRRCFGRPLDKSEQMSDWEKRPLRRAQVRYAALDAHILLELYSKITNTCKEKGIVTNLEPVVTGKAEPHRSKSQRKQMRVAEKTEEQKQAEIRQPPRQGPPMSPQDLAVVVDTMIQGMGRYLRCCGVDVHMLEAGDDHDTAAKIAIKEKRVILTCGQPFHWLRSQVPEGMCYNVLNNVKAREQAIDVLEHYNVNVTTRDIFSRCMTCNCNVYLHIAPEDMRNAWDRKNQLMTEKGQTLPPLRRGTRKTYPVRSGRTDTSNIVFDPVDLEHVTTADGVPIQVDSVPREVTFQVPLFYCCASCGKVFWEGKHFEGVCAQFSEVLNRETSNEDDGEEVGGSSSGGPNPDLASAFKGKLTFK